MFNVRWNIIVKQKSLIISIMPFRNSISSWVKLTRLSLNSTRIKLPIWSQSTNPHSLASRKGTIMKSTFRVNPPKRLSKSFSASTNYKSRVSINNMTKWKTSWPRRSTSRNLPPPINSPPNTKQWSTISRSTTRSLWNKN